jgi:hypothetical protein
VLAQEFADDLQTTVDINRLPGGQQPHRRLVMVASWLLIRFNFASMIICISAREPLPFQGLCRFVLLRAGPSYGKRTFKPKNQT